MSMLRDGYELTIDGCTVRIIGRSGPLRATWSLYEGELLLEEYKAVSGIFDLSGTLSSGAEVDVTIEQASVGPTRVTVHADDEMILDTTGFVL